MALASDYQLPLFPTEKACSACGRLLPLDQFYKKRGTGDGLTSACNDCIKARVRTYQEQNKEARRAYQAARYEANREQIKAEARAYYQENRDACLAQKRTVYARRYHKNKQQGKYRVEQSRRRARACAAEGHFTVADVHDLYAAQNGLCAYCGVALGGVFHIDHVIPLSRGGSNWPDNLALACGPCNMSKGAKTAEEFKALRNSLPQ